MDADTIPLNDVDQGAADEPPTATQRLRAAATRTRRSPQPRGGAKAKAATKRTPPPARPKVQPKTYSAKFIPYVRTGVRMIAGGDPLKREILLHAADEFGPILDRMAAEDPKVAALLDRLGKFAAPGGAKGEAVGLIVKTGGALLLASGRVPGGPPGLVLAMLAGAAVESAFERAAYGEAAYEMSQETGRAVETCDPEPERVELWRQELLRRQQEKLAAAQAQPEPQPAAGHDE